uniref:Acyl CoA binding protein n=1 Tax=Megaviridae environmental sample TaxID=1737588 RepID=A0A5J6VHK3_9VIRU|nr:MAG: acyl CoA binding protein [Megaviridae environmental sample]
MDFNIAAKHVYAQKNNPNVSKDIKLQFYALYKCATIGTCYNYGGKKPWFNVEMRIKWKAWNALGNLSKEHAKHKYIDLLDTVDPNWRT